MKQADKKGYKNKIGAYGEQIAASYLQKKLSFTLLDKNYLKPWGEIDIVARETGEKGVVIHFVEVKTVSYGTKDALNRAVSYGTWRPEEQVTAYKLRKLNRVIDTWLTEYQHNGTWQIDVLAVRVVLAERYAEVRWIPNVIL